MVELSRIGDPDPISEEAISRVETKRGFAYPPQLRELLRSSGAGCLCGWFDILDPRGEDDPASRWTDAQAALAGEARALHARGYWPQFSAIEWEGLTAIATDRRGAALVLGTSNVRTGLMLLHPRGVAFELSDEDELLGPFLSAGELVRGTSLKSYAFQDGRRDMWRTYGRRPVPPFELGVPASYRIGADLDSDAILRCVASNDDPGVDAALERLHQHAVLLHAFLLLIERIIFDLSASELRAATATQLMKLVKRRAPHLEAELSFPAILASLKANTPADPSLRQPFSVNSVMDAPEGPFLYDPSRRPSVSDDAKHAVAPPPLPDAVERGFVAPKGFPPIDFDAEIEWQAASWTACDPDAPIGPLLEHIRAMHPEARRGVGLLIAQCVFRADRFAPELYAHLHREAGEHWPQMILALRSPTWNAGMRWFLAHEKMAQAAPFFLSLVRRPHREGVGLEGEHAEAFVACGGKVEPGFLEEFLPYLQDYLAEREDVQPEHEGAPLNETVSQRKSEVMKMVDGAYKPTGKFVWDTVTERVSRRDNLCKAAAVLLVSFAKDERVFAAYLAHFVDTMPWSAEALKSRKKDPRIIPALHIVLSEEERSCWWEGKRRLYTNEFGYAAEFLASCGDPVGKEAKKKYKAFERWQMNNI